MSWDIDSWVIQTPIEVGTTPVQVLKKEALRAGYRIANLITNLGVIYHGYNSNVNITSVDRILPGGVLADIGEWYTTHHGEVWLVSNLANQNVMVERVICSQKPPGWQKAKWWEKLPW